MAKQTKHSLRDQPYWQARGQLTVQQSATVWHENSYPAERDLHEGQVYRSVIYMCQYFSVVAWNFKAHQGPN